MVIKYKIILLVFLYCFLGSGIYAKETLKEKSPDSDTLEYTLPEIIVKGDDSMRSLKKEVIHAEELKFEVFNNLNSTDDFDISCEWRAHTGTRIKQWRCEVEYMRKALAEAVSDWMHGAPAPFISRYSLAIKYADKTRALNKEMIALAARHPELAVAMINAHELQQLYNDERRRRYKDSIFVGNPPKPDLKLNKIVILEAAFQDHRNGVISDKVWERWDSMYRKLFKIRSYRTLWKSLKYDKYEDEFVSYVNTIIAGK